MKAFMDETGEWTQTGPSVIANRTRYIINDFRTDPMFMDKPYTTGFPYMVSYLEVPLISPLGYVLGSYCVVDNKLRDFNNDETVGIMASIASTIMDHLELVKTKQNKQRAATLVEGLCDFIRHESSLSNQAQIIPRLESRISTGMPGLGAKTSLPDRQSSEAPDKQTGDINNSEAFLPETNPPAPPSLAESSSITTTGEDSRSASSCAEQDMSCTPPTTSISTADQNPFEQLETRPDLKPHDLSPPDGLGQTGATAEAKENSSSVSSNVQWTFSRAAATIRYAMNLDGLIFFDAIPLPSEDGVSLPINNPSSQDALGSHCEIIAHSIVEKSSTATSFDSRLKLPGDVLQNLLRQFPRGHIFSADEFGPIEASYDPGRPFLSGTQFPVDGLPHAHDAAVLFRILPSARYAIFMPLYHYQRECWYAAALGWITDSTEALGPTDVSLLSVFSSSVMTEVSRSEAVAMNNAKFNFISSMSHELRSPLHGILASSELLREGNLDASDLSTLDMIDSCGTTLLDTFNNLIDYANFSNQGIKPVMPVGKLPIANLSELVEDVIEAVNVSYMSENAFQPSIYTKGKDPIDGNYALDDSPNHSVLIFLKLERGPEWDIPIDVGAWKRIVMNIFGNALKYTVSGQIDVGLEMRRLKNKTGELCNHLCFSVKDTGRGIASDYLKYQVLAPFSKEDNLAPGIGLGLSIVNQLVKDLHGTLSIRSSVGQGTSVEILVPIDKGEAGPTPDPCALAAAVGDCRMRISLPLAGRVLCVIAPELYMKLTNDCIKLSDQLQDRSTLISKALQQIASDNLGMKVIVATEALPTPKPDIYFLDAGIIQDTESSEANAKSIIKDLESSPLVLFCPGLRTCSSQEHLRHYKMHLHQPLGPEKLESVISSALTANMNDCDPPHSPLSPRAHRPFLTIPSSPEKEEKQHIQSQDPSAEPNVIEDEGGMTPRHHLLVDDNPINVKLLTAMVRKLNHTYSVAYNGLEAVQQFNRSVEQRQSFDTIFMDVSMPVMNGFEATRQIRQLEKAAGVAACRIVMLTGLGSDTNRDEAFSNGADLFLTKPVKLEKVAELLGSVNA
jgi:signal transduction histidine kinase/CheY-like chemotaxis protein